MGGRRGAGGGRWGGYGSGWGRAAEMAASGWIPRAELSEGKGLKRNGADCNWPRCWGSWDGGGNETAAMVFWFSPVLFLMDYRYKGVNQRAKLPHTHTNKVERTVNCLSAEPRSDVHIIHFPKKRKRNFQGWNLEYFHSFWLLVVQNGTWKVSKATDNIHKVRIH